MQLEMNRIEIIEDLTTGEVAATCTVDEFIEANADWPISEEEIEFLATNSYVVIGGGAAGVVVVRYACEAARERSAEAIAELVANGVR